jgi:hypothetical protein
MLPLLEKGGMWRMMGVLDGRLDFELGIYTMSDGGHHGRFACDVLIGTVFSYLDEIGDHLLVHYCSCARRIHEACIKM